MTLHLAMAANLPAGLQRLDLLSDGLLSLSLFAIAAAVLYIGRKRGGYGPDMMAVIAFCALFMVAIGLSHLVPLAAFWLPGLAGAAPVLKVAGAALACAIALLLWWVAPRLPRVPSRDRLQAEIAAHLQTTEALKEARHQLEERVEARTKELAEAKRRIEIALRGSPIAVFSQDKDMRFTWVHNAPAGLYPEQLIGKTDAEILPAEAAKTILAAKCKTMETGTAQELETNFELLGRKRSFYLMIEALRDEQGAIVGTTSVAVDISERKANEDQLRLLLRELTHRCKNLLAVTQAIARQTAARTRSIDDFLARFSARLAAMGSSHDLLIADDWHGASLRMLVERQLGEHSDRFGAGIDIEGDDVMLKPEAVQNLGLALHELAANAEKFGSLSEPHGSVSIHWRFCEKASKLKLIWEEKGGPPVIPPQGSGFGRAVIENVVGRALGGDVSLSFPAKGVRCEMVIPLAQVISQG
jgi:two-component sensor histidine kinase